MNEYESVPFILELFFGVVIIITLLYNDHISSALYQLFRAESDTNDETHRRG